jgi:predicted Zn-dependent peptidase
VTCVTVSAQARPAMGLLCDALKNADFTADALTRARREILRERQERAADGFDVAYDALRLRARGLPEPSDDALRHVTSERARAYFAAHYVPANTVIAVVGACDAATITRGFATGLREFTRAAPGQAHLESSPKRLFVPQRIALSVSGNAAYALVATDAPAVSSQDYPAFTVLHALLGGGHAARLFRRVRDVRGVGYDVGALYRADRSEPLIAYLQWDARRATSAPTPETALSLLRQQLDALLTTPPPAAEIARARNLAIGRDALRHERARDRAFLLGWYEVMGVGFAFDADLPRRLAAVRPEDVLRVAQIYLPARATALALPNLTPQPPSLLRSLRSPK